MIFLLIFLLLLPVPSLAATYTVCASGCDYTTIQGAVNVAVAGDTVSVGAGTYAESVVTKAHGTSGSRIIIDGGSASTTTLKGFTFNHNYVTVKNFKFAGITTHYTMYVYVSNTTSYGVVDSCIFDADWVHAVYGIFFEMVETPPYTGYSSYYTISNNEFTKFYHYMPMYLDGAYHTVENNNMHDIKAEAFIRPAGWNHTIRGNLFRDNTQDDYGDDSGHADMIDAFSRNTSLDCIANENHIWENNIFYGGWPDPTPPDFTHVQIAQLSGQGSPYAGGWTFRNNLFIEAGTVFWVGMPNMKFYNNVFYNDLSTGKDALQFINSGIIVLQPAAQCTGGSARQASDGLKIFNNVFLNGSDGSDDPDEVGFYHESLMMQGEIATSDGAVDGSTVVNSLYGDVFDDDELNGGTITMTSGACSDQTRTVLDFNGTNGTITVTPSFTSCQTLTGDTFNFTPAASLLKNVEKDHNYVGKIIDGVPYSPFSTFNETPGINGGNPGFVNEFQGCTYATCNFALTSTSILRNAGRDLSDVWNPATDIIGVPRPQGGAWDIGAYEYNEGSTIRSFSIIGSQKFSPGSGTQTITPY